MSSVFLSFVGTQTMSILQPLLACVQAKKDISSIHLYPTEKTIPFADKIKEYCEKNNFPKVTISVLEKKQDIEEIILQEAVEGYDIIFNVDGGLNFAVAKMAINIAKYQDIGIAFTNTRQDCIIFEDCNEKKVEFLRLPKVLPVADILSLNGVIWKYGSPTEASESIGETLRKCGIKMPERYLSRVEINEVLFDLVWNDGANRLCFLTDIYEDSKLDNIRKIFHVSSSREGHWQIFDKELYVLCPSEMMAEHITYESRGKATPVILRSLYYKNDTAETLNSLFRAKRSNLKSGGKVKTISSDTLILALGTDVAVTLNAIVSHKLPHVMLCHTSDAETMRRAANIVSFLPEYLDNEIEISRTVIDINGVGIASQLQLEEGAQNVHVNITPGTKGIAARLALWGARNHCSVWSIDKSMLRLLEAVKKRSMPCTACDPMLILRVTAADGVIPTAEDTNSYADERSALLFQHMSYCFKHDIEWKFAESEYGGVSMQQDTSSRRWSIGKDGKSYLINLNNGEWFEQFVCFVMRKYGYKHVHCRVRLPWTEKIQARLEEKLQEEVHRADLDVIGVSEGQHFLISCKGKLKLDSQNKVAREATQMAASISRFCLPFIAYLGERNYEIETMGRNIPVPVIGWKVLCDHSALQKVFANSLQGKRTSVEEEKK